MSSMFHNCTVLTSIDLQSFKTDKVTDLSNIFNGCSYLRVLDLSKFSTNNVENISGFLAGCKILSSVDLSRFDTSKVTDFSYLFQDVPNPNLFNIKNLKITEYLKIYHLCSVVAEV